MWFSLEGKSVYSLGQEEEDSLNNCVGERSESQHSLPVGFKKISFLQL